MDINFHIYEEHLEEQKRFSHLLDDLDCGVVLYEKKKHTYDPILSKNESHSENKVEIPIGPGKFLTQFYDSRIYPDFVFLNYLKSHPSEYLCSFNRDLLLNDDYEIRLFSDIPTRKFFIRPFTYWKVFPGQVVDFSNLLDIMIFQKTYPVMYNDLVMISKPKILLKEYRFFVYNHQILGQSEYSWDQETPFVVLNSKNDKFFEIEARRFADKVVMNSIFKDNTYLTLDVGLTVENEFKVIEINPGISSGFYNSDVKQIFTKLIQEIKKIKSIDELL